jgi:quinol monooxygenase YgiN
MTAIRMVIQGSFADADSVIPTLQRYIQEARNDAGNLQAELFRGNEFADNLLGLFLWEDSAAFDAHWARSSQDTQRVATMTAQQAPNHHGTPGAPRRHGENGVEFYRQVMYGRVDGAWAPSEEAERPASIRFPAWGPVRIVIQGTSEPGAPTSAQLDNAAESRLEPGCIQFENFRSIDYPENTCLMELWESPEIYDIHWLNRLMQQAPRPGQPPAPPRPTPPERRYGKAGLEWYAHNYFTLVGNVWQPENAARRMTTVRW